MPRYLMLLALCVGAALLVARPDCAYACSCRAPGPPAEELGKSDAVFLGTVVAVTAASGPIVDSGALTTVTFEVAQVWKGQISQVHTITTPGSSAGCGITFEQGRQYVVYGRLSEGVLSANACSRTRLAGDTTEDLGELGAGQPPAANTPPPAHLPATSTAEPLGIASGARVLLGMLGILSAALGAVLVSRSGAGRPSGKR